MTRKLIKRVLLMLLLVAFAVTGIISWALYPKISNLKSEYTTARVIRDLEAFVTLHPGEWPKSWRDLGDGTDRSKHTIFRFDLTHEAVMRQPVLIYEAVTPIHKVYHTYPHAKSQLDEVLRIMNRKREPEPEQSFESTISCSHFHYS